MNGKSIKPNLKARHGGLRMQVFFLENARYALEEQTSVKNQYK